MSTSHYAYALLGVRVERPSRLFRKVLAKVGDHDRPRSERFCATTGRPLWEERWECVVAEAGEKCGPGQHQLPPGYRVLFEYHYDPGSYIFWREPEHGWVGLVVARSGDNEPWLVNAATEEVAIALRDALGPGLYDPREFGLWAVSRLS